MNTYHAGYWLFVASLIAILVGLNTLEQTERVPSVGKNPGAAMLGRNISCAPNVADKLARISRLPIEDASGETYASPLRRGLAWDTAFLMVYGATLLLGRFTLLRLGTQAPDTWSKRAVRFVRRWLWVPIVIAVLADFIENAILYLVFREDLTLLQGFTYVWWLVAWGKFILAGFAAAWIVLELLRAFFQRYWLLEYLFFVRVPAIGALTLFILGLLGLFGPATVTNVMEAHSAVALIILTFEAGFTAVICALAGVLIWQQAPARFEVKRAALSLGEPTPSDTDDEKDPLIKRLSAAALTPVEKLPEGVKDFARERVPGVILGIPFAVISIPLIIALGYASCKTVGYPANIFAVLAGIGLLAVVVLLLEALFHFCAEALRTWGPATKVAGWLGRGFAEYDADGNVARVATGHVRLLITLAVLSIIYIVVGFATNPVGGIWIGHTVVFFLLWIMLLVSVFSYLTFSFDRLRVPVALVTVLWLSFVYAVFDVEQQFDVYKDAGEPASDVTQAAAQRMEAMRPRNPQRIATIVCLSGGGIQAAGWASKALTELDMQFKDFSPSLQLMSSTSGGTVGALYFLETFDRVDGVPATSAGDRAFRSATKSSLASTAWGFVYTDFIRGFLPFVSPHLVPGRAVQMEQLWQERLGQLKEDIGFDVRHGGGNAYFSEWTRLTRTGKMPAIVYNCTVIETGHLLAISTVEFGASSTLNARTLHSRYGGVDILKATAARLSATFPYVTPVASAYHRTDNTWYSPSQHLADGGYIDNHGHMAAVEWVETVMSDPTLREEIDTLVILQISAFQRSKEVGLVQSQDRVGGWFHVAGGPALGLYNVRTASQVARGAMEFEMLKKRYDNVIVEEVRPPNELEGGSVLSWHLNADNIQDLKDAWTAFENSTVFDKVLMRIYTPR